MTLSLIMCVSVNRENFSRAQKRKSGAFRSAAGVMNELQKNIDGWEVSIVWFFFSFLFFLGGGGAKWKKIIDVFWSHMLQVNMNFSSKLPSVT